MKTNAEIAREALGILDESGWCKSALSYTDFRMRTRHCVGGLVNLAMFGNDYWYSSREKTMAAMAGKQMEGTHFYVTLLAKIREMYPDFVFPEEGLIPMIADWNNAPERTEAEVRDVLEKIAAG